MYPRMVRALVRDTRRSVLLLGPRQTGKSTLLRSLDPDLEINLADEETFLRFAGNPGELTQRLGFRPPRVVFIDEIQRLPSLLNTIQAILDRPTGRPARFLLTGSSARKLRRGRANLLPGRVVAFQLGPLTTDEMGERFDLGRCLSLGSLPGIYSEPDAQEAKRLVRSYAATYVREEIQAEALTRSIEGFSRFLPFAAASSGRILDFTRIASEAQVNRMTASRYFEILEDTLICRRCDPFSRSERRRLVRSPKYYFFDPGVMNSVLGNFQVSPERKGFLFETLVHGQLVTCLENHEADWSLGHYRTEHGAEVDFILQLAGETWAIEVKASLDVGPNDFRGFASFGDYCSKPFRSVVVYAGEHPRKVRGVDVLPLPAFIEAVSRCCR